MAKSLHPSGYAGSAGLNCLAMYEASVKGIFAIWALAALRESDFELNLALGSCRQSWPFPNPVTNPLSPFAPLASFRRSSREVNRAPLPTSVRRPDSLAAFTPALRACCAATTLKPCGL